MRQSLRRIRQANHDVETAVAFEQSGFTPADGGSPPYLQLGQD